MHSHLCDEPAVGQCKQCGGFACEDHWYMDGCWACSSFALELNRAQQIRERGPEPEPPAQPTADQRLGIVGFAFFIGTIIVCVWGMYSCSDGIQGSRDVRWLGVIFWGFIGGCFLVGLVRELRNAN